MSSLYDESALDPLGLNQGMLGGSGGEDLHTYLKRLSRPSLELKEGDGLRVSKDPNNKGLTAGGHWLGENSGYNEGDLISPQQKADWYDSDFDAAYRGAMKNFKGFEQLDRDQQLAALSVSYQNGEFLEQEHPNATSLWRQGMFNEGAAEFAKNSAGDGPADWLSQPQAERQLDDLKTLTKGFDITDPSTWRTGAGIALENVPGTTIKAPTDRSLATGAPASTALAAAGVPPAPNQQPGSNDATSAIGKAGEWVGALGTEFGASLADMGSLIADMADFGQFGPDDFTDKLAAKMSGFADTMRKSKPAWIQAQEQNEIVSYGKDGSLEFNMPNFTQVANLIVGSLAPGGAIAKGGVLATKGLTKIKAVEKWIKAGKDTSKFTRAAGTRAAGVGAANSAYITADTYQETYKDVLAERREDGDSLTVAHEKAGNAATMAAMIMAPISFATGAAGMGLAATGTWKERLAKGMVYGGLTEAPEEFWQSAAGDIGAGKNIDVAKAANAAALGFFGGAFAEGPMAAWAGVDPSTDPKADPIDPDPAKTETPTPPNAAIAAGIADTDANTPGVDPVTPPAAPPGQMELPLEDTVVPRPEGPAGESGPPPAPVTDVSVMTTAGAPATEVAAEQQSMLTPATGQASAEAKKMAEPTPEKARLMEANAVLEAEGIDPNVIPDAELEQTLEKLVEQNSWREGAAQTVADLNVGDVKEELVRRGKVAEGVKAGMTPEFTDTKGTTALAAIGGAEGDTRVHTMKINGVSAGGISYTVNEETGSARISITDDMRSEVPRGEGFGVEHYKQFIEEQTTKGLTVTSDNDVSVEAGRVYAALKVAGYGVETSPYATYDEESGWIDADGGPVFTITSVPEQGSQQELLKTRNLQDQEVGGVPDAEAILREDEGVPGTITDLTQAPVETVEAPPAPLMPEGVAAEVASRTPDKVELGNVVDALGTLGRGKAGMAAKLEKVAGVTPEAAQDVAEKAFKAFKSEPKRSRKQIITDLLHAAVQNDLSVTLTAEAKQNAANVKRAATNAAKAEAEEAAAPPAPEEEPISPLEMKLIEVLDRLAGRAAPEQTGQPTGGDGNTGEMFQQPGRWQDRATPAAREMAQGNRAAAENMPWVQHNLDMGFGEANIAIVSWLPEAPLIDDVDPNAPTRNRYGRENMAVFKDDGPNASVPTVGALRARGDYARIGPNLPDAVGPTGTEMGKMLAWEAQERQYTGLEPSLDSNWNSSRVRLEAGMLGPRMKNLNDPSSQAPEGSGSPPSAEQTARGDANDPFWSDDLNIEEAWNAAHKEGIARARQKFSQQAIDKLIETTDGTNWGDAWNVFWETATGGGGKGKGKKGGNNGGKRDWSNFAETVKKARATSKRVWMERLIDQHYTIKQIQDLMAAQGSVVADAYRLHDAMTRVGAVSEVELLELQRTLIDPVSELVAEKKGMTWEAASEFIAYVHSSSRNDYILQKQDSMYVKPTDDYKGGSGTTRRQAEEQMAAFEKKHGRDFAIKLEDAVFDMSARLREILAPGKEGEPGLTTNKDYEDWKVDNDFHADYRTVRKQKGMVAAQQIENYAKFEDATGKPKYEMQGDNSYREFSDLVRRQTYVPLMDIETPGIVEAMLGDYVKTAEWTSELDMAGFESKEAAGRETVAKDAMTHLAQQLQRGIIRRNRNIEVMGRLWDTIDNLNDPRIGVAFKEEEVGTRAYTDREALERLAKKNYPETMGPLTIKKDVKPFVFRQKMGDNVRAVIIYDASLARALSNQRTTQGIEKLFRTINTPGGYVRRAFTSWNPEFTAVNFIREVANARIQGRSIRGLTPAQQKLVTKSINLKSGYDWAMTYWREERDPGANLDADLRSGKIDRAERKRRIAIRELRAAGMHSAFHEMQDPQAKDEELAKSIELLSAKGDPLTVRANVKRGIVGIGSFLNDAANASENGVRAVVAAQVADSLTGTKDGDGNVLTREEAVRVAASAGKDLSVNFQRYGTWGQRINSLYFFFNPSIQGLYRAKQAMHHKGVRNIAFGIGATGIAMALLNRVLAGEDEDDRNIYETTVPDYKRERNMIIMMPGGEGKYASIPLPYVYNLPYMVGDMIVSALLGAGDNQESQQEAVTKLLTKLPGVAFKALSPISSNSFSRGITPSLAEPFYDVAANQSWYNTTINPIKNPFDPSPVPDAYNVRDPDQKKVAQFFAQMMSTSSQFEAGMIDVSPGTLEYMFSYYTGGVGSFITRLADAAGIMMAGDVPDVKDLPMIRKAYGLGESKPDDRRRYYELRTRMASIIDHQKTLRENYAVDPAAYNMFMELEGHHWQTGTAQQFTKAEKRVRMYSRERNRLSKQRNKTPQQLDRIEYLNGLSSQSMLDFNTYYFDRIAMEGY